MIEDRFKDTFIRFHNSATRERLMPLLYHVYRFESSRVAGAHGGSRLLDQCLWTKAEILPHLPIQVGQTMSDLEALLDELIAYLSSNGVRHLLRFKSAKRENEYVHITRVAEMIRTTGNLHEFHNRDSTVESIRKYSIIEGTQWYPILRYGMPREYPPSTIRSKLEIHLSGRTHLPQSKGGHLIVDALSDVDLVLKSIGSMTKFKRGKGLMFSKFQVDGIVKTLLQSWTDTMGEAVVITADTGMGKTLGFAIPVIVDAVLSLRNPQKTLSQLLLYPRVALAKDQYNELHKYVARVNTELSSNDRACIGIAVDAEGLIKNIQKYKNYPFHPSTQAPKWGVGATNVSNATKSVYGGEKPAQILIASIESFRRRLRFPVVAQALGKGLQRLIFDEVHLSSSIQGAHHNRLVARLKQIIHLHSRKLTVVGVSATIAKPIEHISKIWGCKEKHVQHVNGTAPAEGSAAGIMHHVLFKPRRGTPIIGALVDMSSSILHQRRSNDFERKNSTDLQKTIGFSDSHEIVGNWHTYMLDNEATSDAKDRRTLYNKPKQPLRRPYPHWHDQPLQIHENGKDVCDSCQKMQYHATPLTIQGDGLLKFKERTDHTLSGDHSSWDLDLDTSRKYEINGLDSCTYLQQGKCWWFAPRKGTIDIRPGDASYLSHSEVVRSMRYTAVTKPKGESGKATTDQSANSVFRSDLKKGAFPNSIENNAWYAMSDKSGLHDFAIATPTLEVGVDMDNVSEVITHKAIRNISSYRQKVGRAGREVGSDVMAVTLVSMHSSDFHHFRSVHELVAKKLIEPVPVALNNVPVQKHHLYEAVFDFLSLNEINVESIPKMSRAKPGTGKYDEWQNINKPLHDSINLLMVNGVPSTAASEYLKAVSNLDGDDALISEAITTAVKHLQVFLELCPNLDQDVTFYQWLAHFKRNPHHSLSAPDVNDQCWIQIKQTLEQDGLAKITFDKINNLLLVQTGEGILGQVRDALEFRNVKDCKSLAVQIKTHNLHTYPLFMMVVTWIDALKDTNTGSQHPFLREIEDGLEQKTIKWGDLYYLSSILEKIQLFLVDRPFIALPSFFTNPHEENVPVVNPKGGWEVDSVSRSDVHRYLQPGMFTHRLKGGSRYFIPHDGLLNWDENTGAWRYSIDGAPITYNQVQSLTIGKIRDISPLLDATLSSAETRAYSFTSIGAEWDSGMVTTSRMHVKLSDEKESRGLIIDKDIQAIGHKLGVRPKAYPINWKLTDSDYGSDIGTYSISNMEPAHKGALAQHLAQRHPLLSVLFDSVTYHDELKVNDLAMGVTRSNGIVIQPQQNHQSVVFSNTFKTQGIRLQISNQILSKAKIMAQGNSVPFTTQTLAAMGYWIRKNRQRFGSSNSFSIEGTLDTLVQHAWINSSTKSPSKSLPATEKDFFELIFDSGIPVSTKDFKSRARLNTLTEDETLDSKTESFQIIYAECIANKGDFLNQWSEIRADWNRYTLLNTLGVLIGSTVAEFAGVQGNSIGYTFSDDGETTHLDVFDDDSEGNGSCELAMKYFHLPFEIRETALKFKDDHLPSRSVADLLEQRLQLCPEHIVQNCAIVDVKVNGLESFHSEQNDLRSRFEVLWSQHNVKTLRQASLHARRKFAIEDPGDRSEQLKLELALTVCYDGCPSCSGDGMMNQMPPHLVSFATNRGLLDEIIGAFSNVNGYNRMITDHKEIYDYLGCDLANVSPLILRHNTVGQDFTIEFRHHLGSGIGFDLERNFIPHPELKVDLVVRTQELV